MAILSPLSGISTFAELLPIVKNAEAKMTWHGVRSVLLKPDQEAKSKISWLWTRSFQLKSEQEVDIDVLADCMIDLIEENQNFSADERLLVKKISSHIDHIYDKSDELKFSNCFPITCIFAWIRDLFTTRWSHFGYSGTRSSWSGRSDMYIPGDRLRHLFYTKEQYEKEKGCSPSPSSPKVSSTGDPTFWWDEGRPFPC